MIKYEASKGNRIKHCFMGMTTLEYWWFNCNTNKWEQVTDFKKGNHSSHQPCNSVRAFRRKLKQAPVGVKFILCSRWDGHDVFGFGSSVKQD